MIDAPSVPPANPLVDKARAAFLAKAASLDADEAAGIGQLNFFFAEAWKASARGLHTVDDVLVFPGLFTEDRVIATALYNELFPVWAQVMVWGWHKDGDDQHWCYESWIVARAEPFMVLTTRPWFNAETCEVEDVTGWEIVADSRTDRSRPYVYQWVPDNRNSEAPPCVSSAPGRFSK